MISTLLFAGAAVAGEMPFPPIENGKVKLVVADSPYSPELPKSLDIENLLIEIRSTLAEFLDDLGDVTMWTGIKSECENFFHQVNKTIYLIKIAKRGD